MSRRIKVMRFALGVCSCLVMLALAAVIVRDVFSGQPFRMTVRPANGHAVVQFTQPDRKLSSPEYRADVLIEKSYAVDLRSGEVAVPGCKIEFYDTTLLPGRFQLWVGRTFFDVMLRGIIVEGKEYDWGPGGGLTSYPSSPRPGER